MSLNWKYALGFGLGLWAIIFIGVSAIMVTPLALIWQKIAEIILVAVAAFILAKIYFKKNPGDLLQGFVLALSWFIVGIILDLLVTIQYVKGTGTYVDGLKEFYGTWNLWAGIVLMFVAVALAAKITRGGELMQKPQPPSPQPPTTPISPTV